MAMLCGFSPMLAATSLAVVNSAAAAAAAAATPPVDLDGAVAYVAKQANRTNTLHPSRVLYPDRVFTNSGGSEDGSLAQWHVAHAPGSWTSGFWVGVNWFAPLLFQQSVVAVVMAQNMNELRVRLGIYVCV